MMVATHIFSLVWLVFLFATMRYSVQMFQQNSYRVERYNRWLCSTGEWYSRANLVAVLGGVALTLLPHWGMMLCLGAWMLIISIAEFSIKYKIKLAYTMRVKRLMVTRLVMTFAIVALVHIYAPRYTYLAMMLLCVDYWTILANIINKPLENAITRWY